MARLNENPKELVKYAISPRRMCINSYYLYSFNLLARFVFNIKGNDYRRVVAMHYNRQIAYIHFVGTHRQYDQIDATTV